MEEKINTKVPLNESDRKHSLNSEDGGIIGEVIQLSRVKRIVLFWILIVTSLLLNTDHGTIPAAIEEIQKDLDLNKKQVGTFGSSVYIGTAVGALFLSFFINKMNRRYMVAISFFFSGVLIFVFTYISDYWLLFINRFFVGFSQSLISIYIPVWIDQFINTNRKTIFMAIFQLSSLIGILIGYILTVIVKDSYKVSFLK